MAAAAPIQAPIASFACFMPSTNKMEQLQVFPLTNEVKKELFQKMAEISPTVSRELASTLLRLSSRIEELIQRHREGNPFSLYLVKTGSEIALFFSLERRNLDIVMHLQPFYPANQLKYYELLQKTTVWILGKFLPSLVKKEDRGETKILFSSSLYMFSLPLFQKMRIPIKEEAGSLLTIQMKHLPPIDEWATTTSSSEEKQESPQSSPR